MSEIISSVSRQVQVVMFYNISSNIYVYHMIYYDYISISTKLKQYNTKTKPAANLQALQHFMVEDL